MPRLYFFICGNAQLYKRTHVKPYLYFHFSAPVGEEGKNLLFTSKFMLIHFQLPFFVCVCLLSGCHSLQLPPTESFVGRSNNASTVGWFFGGLPACAADMMNPNLSSLVNRGVYSCCGGGGGEHKTGTSQRTFELSKNEKPFHFSQGPTVETIPFCTK